ncbi:methyltransferase [Gordonia phage LilyPad]|nr:methyltransferase [Gordonia phage LilyPad]
MTDKTQVFKDPTCIWDHIDIAMVRDPKHYTYKMNGLSTRGEKIQLGAGFKNIEGWRNLEYPAWDADWPIPAEGFVAGQVEPDGQVYDKHPLGGGYPVEVSWDYSRVKGFQDSESVSEIASYHTLDHLSPRQVINTLREVERVLVPGGTFTNIVPHADSQLAKECIHHQSRFMIDTWRNIFSERQYEHDGEWNLEVGLNFVFGIAERNVVLVTQLVKR